jgi:malate dehydrogenase (oxaloacetate-decarboxylating)
MIAKMKPKPIIFALANPEPEIKVELAEKCGVKIIATGRSDYPNQVNNVLGFPGIFRGALDANAKEINMEMKLSSARALADTISDEIREDYIIPKPFDGRVLPAVAVSVAKAAVETGYAPKDTDLEWIEDRAKNILKR